jgi:hypothetical protein
LKIGRSQTCGITPNTFDAVLPNVPDDESFIIALKTGGELKVNPTSVLSAIKAAIADKLGFFNLPKSIKEKMEKFAESIDEPVNPEFFKLQKLVTTRNYADVLNALGVEGQFMNDARQNAFLKKLDVKWNGVQIKQLKSEENTVFLTVEVIQYQRP